MKQTRFKKICAAFLAFIMLLGTLSPMASADAAQQADEYLTISDFNAGGEISSPAGTAITPYTTEKSIVGSSFKTEITYEDVEGGNSGWWNALFYGASAADLKNCVTIFVAPTDKKVYAYINGAEGGDLGVYAGPTVPNKGEGTLELLLEIDISAPVAGKSTITIKFDGETVLQKENVDTSSYANKLIVQTDGATISAVYRDYVVQQQQQESLKISDFNAGAEISSPAGTATTPYTTEKSIVGSSFKTEITYEDVEGGNSGWWNALFYGASAADLKNCVTIFVAPTDKKVYAYINGAEGGDLGVYAGPTVPNKGEGTLELLLEIDISAPVAGKSTITIKFDGETVLQRENVDTSSYANKLIVQTDGAPISAVYRDYVVQPQQDIKTVTVSAIQEYTQWNSNISKWEVYLGITEDLSSLGEWTALTGMTYSVNGGLAQNLSIQTGFAGQLYIPLAVDENTKNLTVTIQGTALNAEGDKGITFENPITLYGTTSGWSLQPQNIPQDITKVTVNSVSNAFYSGKWYIFFDIAEPLTGHEWHKFDGMTYKEGANGEEKAIDAAWWDSDNGKLYLEVPVAENYETGKTLTIQGTGMCTSCANKGIEFTAPITLSKTSSSWSLQPQSVPQDIKKVTVNSISEAFYSGKWYIFFDIAEPLTGHEWHKFDGMTYKEGANGAEKAIDAAYWDSDNGKLYLEVPVAESYEIGKTLTIQGIGMCTSCADKGIEFTAPITLYKSSTGWSLQPQSVPQDIKKVTANKVLTETAWNSSKSQWEVYLGITGDLSGIDEWTPLAGMTYSVDGGAPQTLTVYTGFAGQLYFALPIGKNAVSKITIDGIGLTGNKGIEFTDSVTLYVNESGWSLTGFLPKINYVKTSAESVNYVTTYNSERNKWYIYLNMEGDLSKFPYYENMTGFEYSIDGGAKKDLIECHIEAHDGGTLFFTLSDLPKQITKNTKIVITGKAKTNSGSGVELTKEITLYANENGWSLTGYPKAIDYVKTSAKSINYVTTYNSERNKWYIYLNMEGDLSKIPYYENMTGFEYSIDGGEKKDLTECHIEAHDGGTLFFTLSELPKQITKNTKIVITGKAKTNSGAGVQLTKDIELYANEYGFEIGKYKGAPVYTDIKVESVNYATSFIKEQNVWHVYLNTDTMLPGEVDFYFNGMVLEVNGKKYDVTVQHAMHEHTLFFVVEEEWLSSNASNGARVTLKAGKALQQATGLGINLKKDVTLYKFFETLILTRPTANTKYTDITFRGLPGATGFNEGAKTWFMELQPHQELPGEQGSNYFYITAYLNGKKLQLKGTQEGKNIMIGIPESDLPRNTKTATLTIKAGTKAVSGYGEIGIRVTEDFSVYLFNGMWSDEKFDKIKEVELFCTRLFNKTDQPNLVQLYFYVNSEFPGKPWYHFFDFQVEVDGKKVDAQISKADSAAGKILYLAVPKEGWKMKEGTVITIKAGTETVSGGYKIKITKDFQVIYTNGMWVENRESDVKAPAAQNLWDVARFEEGYIPTTIDGTVLMSGENEYSKIATQERMKDFTISFSGKKIYDDAGSPSFSLIMRGTPISEDDPISLAVLNGYVITFEGYEYTEEMDPTRPDLWGVRTCHINIWKNGVNNSLKDQYCIGTYHNQSDNPFFKYDETYNYEVSVYNISETVACIEFRVNGELAYKCYDEAGTDPADPAINAGIFAIQGVAPTYYGGEIVELDTVIAEKTECKVGEEVVVAATYPSILTGAEFTVDKEGAQVENGKFGATKAGTYTISATYNGKELKPIKITVKERVIAADDDVNGARNIPPVVMVISIVTGVLFIGGGIWVALNMRKKKRMLNSEK